MSRLQQVVATLALVVLAASTAAAFQCNICLPTPHKDCSKSSDRVPEECPGGVKAYCRKMIQDVISKRQFVYQCGLAEGGMDKPYYNTANDYVKASVFHCNNEPNCNGAGHYFLSKVMAVGIVAVAWMLH